MKLLLIYRFLFLFINNQQLIFQLYFVLYQADLIIFIIGLLCLNQEQHKLTHKRLLYLSNVSKIFILIYYCENQCEGRRIKLCVIFRFRSEHDDSQLLYRFFPRDNIQLALQI